MKTNFEEIQADFLRNVDPHTRNFYEFYILWFPTEGHFALLKKQEIFSEQNDFYGLLVDFSAMK